MTLTAAQLAAMPRVTPTQLAEEAYQARAGKSYPPTTGPAGIALPDPRQQYRPSRDPATGTEIGRAAYAAHRASVLTEERQAALAATLSAALTGAYPVADMDVLQRYGAARVIGRSMIEMGRYGVQWVNLPEPLAVPKDKGSFFTGVSGSGDALPAEAAPYFDDLAAVLDAQREFMAIQTWPGSFKALQGRWPRWAEIEKGLPPIGAWMAQERAAAQPKGDQL